MRLQIRGQEWRSSRAGAMEDKKWGVISKSKKE